MGINEQQIKQVIGQIEASMDKIETNIEEEEYKDYCDSAYTLITYWKIELKKLKTNEQ